MELTTEQIINYLQLHIDDLNINEHPSNIPELILTMNNAQEKLIEYKRLDELTKDAEGPVIL